MEAEYSILEESTLQCNENILYNNMRPDIWYCILGHRHKEVCIRHNLICHQKKYLINENRSKSIYDNYVTECSAGEQHMKCM